jgi:hypothetical protein
MSAGIGKSWANDRFAKAVATVIKKMPEAA